MVTCTCRNWEIQVMMKIEILDSTNTEKTLLLDGGSDGGDDRHNSLTTTSSFCQERFSFSCFDIYYRYMFIVMV